jgi:ribosomal protein S1/(E)-4-hydroxy-3-methyl-but-2-enyl pyrophosphate reductase
LKIILAKTAGFCFGVRRAVNICEQAARSTEHCVTLGPIIHNTSVTEKLAGQGVGEIEDVACARQGDTVIVRSHGIGRAEYEYLQASGATVIDATCPDVAKIHDIVQKECADGRMPVIIGDPGHPEVAATAGWCSRFMIFSSAADLDQWVHMSPENAQKPLSIVSQTTATRSIFELCVKIIKKECTNYKIFDTICNTTLRRQNEAAEIARQADAMIVIGGRHSANSVHLAEICREYCARVFFIENASQLDMSAFHDSDTVGITAGASTPAWIIKEVNQKMSEEIKVDGITEEVAAEETESFEEMLEKSIKTLYTGEKVTGVIAAITPTEVSVDLGTKQSGYIPLSELTDDPSEKVEDLVKVGDEIETYVMRVNDVEGTVMLSKKRLDSAKNWEFIDNAREEKLTVEGTIVEENKGGVVALVKGIRVFIPASQTGLAKGVPMSNLLKTKARMRITEVNQSRRRVVGSIRAVVYEERKAKAEQIWNEIEVGKKYNGVVKSMTSYGAFIDIGGIDGMVHVSELSWTRIHQPSDVLSVGDEVEVYVLSFDKEKKKISLGYKKEEDNPWVKFTNNYNVDDVINVKIVKLMPFGAFAEIIPGVDGLIHISQIADHRIGQPSEVLTEGQNVDVKITDIDTEKHKVSLSIRALLSTPMPQSEDIETTETDVVEESMETEETSAE